jgi:cell pole-organizing protein PopZ
MEEILASIRRIIEDNDTGRKPGDTETARVGGSTVIEVDAFRADLRTPPLGAMETVSSKPERQEPAERKPVTLAEVQAQIAAETRSAPPRWTPPVAPQPPVAEAAPKPVAPSPKPIDADAALKPAARPAAEPEIAAKPVTEAPKAAATSLPATVRPAGPDAVAAKPTILSERAERQVAAAFGELSEAFAQRSKKTFDDMAEEMLRPMLQDWLDNNLPGLVERLVREEIERVARGVQ